MREAESEQEKIFELKSAVKSGAGWFGAIALLSMLNTILITSNIDLNFVFGLGITQVIDYLSLSKTPGGTGTGPGGGTVISILIAAIFLVFAHYAKKRQRWAFITGTIVYGLDGLIIVTFGDFLSFGFHIIAIMFILKGLAKLQDLERITADKENITRNEELQTVTSGYTDSTSVVICPNCNTEVNGIYNYCMNCGEKLDR